MDWCKNEIWQRHITCPEVVAWDPREEGKKDDGRKIMGIVTLKVRN